MNGSRIDLVLTSKLDGLEIDDQVGKFFGDLTGLLLVLVVPEVFLLGLKVKVKLPIKVGVAFWSTLLTTKVATAKPKIHTLNNC